MLKNLRRIVLGDALANSSRERLVAWLVACRTRDASLRAGVPPGWRVGDKTGSGANNATNDVAVLWPPNRAPIIVTAYSIEAHGSRSERLAVLAEVGRVAATI
jgi:beta-lactamase class A